MLKKYVFGRLQLGRVLSGMRDVIIWPLRTRCSSVAGCEGIVIGGRVHFVRDYAEVSSEPLPFRYGGEYLMAETADSRFVRGYSGELGYWDSRAVPMRCLTRKFRVTGISVMPLHEIDVGLWNNNGKIPSREFSRAGVDADMFVVYRIVPVVDDKDGGT